MIQPPAGFRFVTNPDLERVAGLMQATWQQPCWHYSPELLGYHLRQPDIDPELLLGLEDTRSGDLTAFYAFMPVIARIESVSHAAVFGSFLTSSAAVQGRGAARAVQARLLEMAIDKGYHAYFAFCEDGAVSNHSIARSCASMGMTTDAITSVTYHAAPCSSRRHKANVFARPFLPSDAAAAVRLMAPLDSDVLSLRYSPEAYRRRWMSPLGESFVFAPRGEVRGILHLAFFDVLDAGQRFTNAYVKDLASDGLSPEEIVDFLGAALVQVKGRVCRLVFAPGVGALTAPLLAAAGFRKTPRRLNLLGTLLEPSTSIDVSWVQRFSLDVF